MLSSQKQSNVWYFGNKAGIDFNTKPPTALLKGQTDFISSTKQWNEGSSSICDSAGALLFYTNGVKIWNKIHQVMSSGTDLAGHASSTQSSIIVPRPGSSRYFYVFTTDALENNFKNGFRYSVVDMCLNRGLGDVLFEEKNILLADTVAEKLVAIKHSNGKDYWLVVQKLKTDAFYSFRLSDEGISETVISHTGTAKYTGVGQLIASPNGKMLANATINDSYQSVFYPGHHSLFDFDNTSGIVSNERIFPSTTTEYAVAFSPDNSKLYFSTIGHGEINQYNLDAGNFEEIVDSRINILNGPDSWRQMQLGPDGKIYISRTQKLYLSSIENANETGLLCNYRDSAVYLGGKLTSFGLPNFIAGYDYTNTKTFCITDVETYFENEELTIAPNPFSQQTTLESDVSFIAASYIIYDLHGRKVKQRENISGRTITIDRDNLPCGLYIIKLTDGSKSYRLAKLLIVDF